MKKALALLLALLLTLGLAACDNGQAAPAAPETITEPAATADPEVPAEPAAPAVPVGDALTFSTTDLSGAAWDQSAFAENTVTMINFWEYWCPPCVEELPYLQKLYETYGDQGFAILGVFSDAGDMDAVHDRIDEAGLTYPILNYSPDFDHLQTGYVPTTVFVDAQGRLLGEAVIGSNSYEGWVAIVEGLL